MVDENGRDEEGQDWPADPQYGQGEQGREVPPRSELEPDDEDAAGSGAAPGTPDTGGLDAYLAEPTDAASEVEPPNEEVSGSTDIPPSSPRVRKGPSALTIVLSAVLVFAMLLLVVVGVKLNDDKKQIAAAMSDTLQVLEAAGIDGATRPQVVALRNALEAGRYGEVKGLVADMLERAAKERPEQPELMDTESGKGPVGGKLPPEAYAEFSEDEAAYFRQHEDLLAAFLEQCSISRQLRDEGVDVDDLRAVRDAIKEAARLGEHDKVEALLAQMVGMNRAKGGGGEPAAIPEDVRPLVEEFHKTAQEAHRQGRDVQPALELLKRAELLAEEGKMDEAKSVIRRALAAARDAKKMRRPSRAGRAPMVLRRSGERRAPREPQVDGGAAAFLLQSLMGMISVEEVDLMAAYQQIDNAMVAVREKNAEQIREILDGALDRFSAIGKRRQEFSKMMNEIVAKRRADMRERGVRGQREGATRAGPGERPAGQDRPEGFGPMPAERREAMRELATREIVDILERAHGLTEEQFGKRKQAIADEVLAMLRPELRPGEGADPSQLEGITLDGEREQVPPMPGYQSEKEKAAAEQRIREKLQAAQEPLSELREAEDNEQLVAELDELFSAVREALYASKYMEAEKLTNEGLVKLGITVADPGPVGETQPAKKTDAASGKPAQPAD
jgi:uncharacterized membrane protein